MAAQQCTAGKSRDAEEQPQLFVRAVCLQDYCGNMRYSGGQIGWNGKRHFALIDRQHDRRNLPADSKTGAGLFSLRHIFYSRRTGLHRLRHGGKAGDKSKQGKKLTEHD